MIARGRRNRIVIQYHLARTANCTLNIIDKSNRSKYILYDHHVVMMLKDGVVRLGVD